MLELIFAGISIFGEGSWRCVHKYDYPQRNVRETFVSNVEYSNDLSYVATSKIIYSRLKEKEVFAQFSYTEKGVAVVSGQNFYLEGQAYNVVRDFDKTGHFDAEYTAEVSDFLNAPMSQEEKTLTVVSSTKTSMRVKHQSSGTITECEAIRSGV